MQPEARPEVLQLSKMVLGEELAHEQTTISRPRSAVSNPHIEVCACDHR
jgi:hypothetical protein